MTHSTATRSSAAAIDWLTPALVAVFVLSGASGLIYQISWVRLLSLTFGVTIYAVSTVVAAFMGGLALGSFVGGRFADRVRRPILWYAVAELAIAAIGLLSPTALSWAQNAYLALYPRDAEQAVLSVIGLRFSLAAAVLLVPATLMGSTLPLMVKGSLAMGRDVSSRVSWLYAGNTAGAIGGTIVSGFILIGAIGIAGTIATAAVFNLAAAAFALALGVVVRPSESVSAVSAGGPGQELTGAGPADEQLVSEPVRRLVILTFAVQGFASLAYEIVWTRAIAFLLDGSTYAFSIVLATVLLGIALGSALVGPTIGRKWPWVRIYALLQTGVACLAFLGVVGFARIYGITAKLHELPFLQPALDSHVGWMAIVAIIIVLPPMLLLGASFPVAARIVVAGRSGPGRRLGFLYAGNTAGAILGAWLAGFFLLPSFGSQTSIMLLAALSAALAVALAVLSGGRSWKVTAIVAALLPLGGAAVAVLMAPHMYGQMVAGRLPGRELMWVGEGQETSVAVVRSLDSGRREMYLNGQAQASDDGGMVWFHGLLAHVPMVVHPNPQDILIVGLGGGATAGAIARHEPRQIDVVELSESVVQGAKYFDHVNGEVSRYPGLRLRIDDGRNYLLLTTRKYDLITADVIHPRNAGSAVLYSYEYYDLARKALKPGGVMSQWLEDSGENPDNLVQRKLMARTFLAAFPYVTMWVHGSLLLGTNEPQDNSLSTIAAHWQQRRLEGALANSGLESPEDVRGLYSLSDAELRAWAGDGPIMTDNNPYVEYFFSLPEGSVGWRGRTSSVHPIRQ